MDMSYCSHRSGQANAPLAQRSLYAIIALVLVAQLALPLWAQNQAQPSSTSATNTLPIDPSAPLPQDSGVAGLKQMLRRLSTTARLMQTVAHPDDEDGGMLTLESRGKGASVVLLTLNRGEGGQNKIGSNLFDVLGVLRTLELTAADRYYGVEQRFTRVADFGFSKNPEETFQKWQGHDVALADMVRVIRTFRPNVLVARFSGTDRDGHGHHQASSLLTQEAFRAAADPSRFPEQITEGLKPWQASKLYIGNVCGFMAPTCPAENYTLRLNTGKTDPDFGHSYIQFAMRGLKHQLSQGAGGWTVEPGDRFTFYKLVDSQLPGPTPDKEEDFFDGIDTSLPGLASQLGADEAKAPYLHSGLLDMQHRVEQAKQATDPRQAAVPLLEGLRTTHQLIEKVEASSIAGPAKATLLAELLTKQQQFQEAANLALGLKFSLVLDAPPAANPETAFMAVSGQAFPMVAKLEMPTAGEVQVDALKVRFTAAAQAAGGTCGELAAEWPRQPSNPREMTKQVRITPCENAQPTRPYWHRANPETDSVNTVDDTRWATLPFPPAPLQAVTEYAVGDLHGSITTVGMVRYKNSVAVAERALAIAPPFSVSLEPASQVIPVSHQGGTDIRVLVRSNVKTSAGIVRLTLPAGWRSEPAEQRVSLQQPNQSQWANFQVFPGKLQEGRFEVRAGLESEGKTYGDGYSIVTREDLNMYYYYQPAVQRVSVVDVNVPAGLKIGYIMGAGDDIPAVLQQLGLNVKVVDATQDLSGFSTVVLGIRAYDTQKDVVANNKKFLDFVAAGGTLLVQYNASTGDFNNEKLTPYPAQLSRARVSVEESPVELLAPASPVFHFPNQIGPHDFDGWVQERGLYFMDQWDSKFEALLACNDPGEKPQKGGLLLAHYGKGTYIYTGYSFFRQLPAGVPGAVRLYVNLLSAGRE